MANYTTAEDLVDDVLDRCSEPTDGTSDFNDAALRFLNRAYLGILSGGAELDPNVNEIWHWLKSLSASLIIAPLTDAGTVSVTNNSSSITFSSAPASSVSGYAFKVDGHPDLFHISSHTGGNSSAALDSVYTGDTDSAASYELWQLDYDLESDTLYPIMFQAWRDGHRLVEMIDLQDMNFRFPVNDRRTGVPTHVAMSDQTTVRFNTRGSTEDTEYIKIDYDYIKQPTLLTDDASSIPEVPHQYRKVLADWAYAFLLEEKNDNRASGAAALARNGLRAMALDNRRRMQFASADSFGRIDYRQRQLRRFRGPLRTESGLIIG